ncbi:MAG: mobile mystery protein A [Capsulimonas sp.]|uniref:mobile mystery protein A n=1 Tax=Capsulimonas sp. TaxID=2494211 RepID=UPI0032633806
MRTSKIARTTRRRQLDRALSGQADLRLLPKPRRGWIRDVRDALGMSAAQLAVRIGVSQPSVAKMEKSEAEGTITLQSLRRAADAMDCMLVYAMVPRRSLETFVTERAEDVARRLVGRVAHTMALEQQGMGTELDKRQAAELAAELVRTLSPELWRDFTEERSQ